MNKQTPTTEFEQPSNEQKVDVQPKVKTWDKILNILLVVVVLALIATLVTKAFFVTNVVVSGDSMLPTYTDGTVVKVDRRANVDDICRGDVVVFYQNHPGWFREHFDVFRGDTNANDQHRLLIKRVVAIQGDKIWVEQVGNKYRVKIERVDGQIVGEWYAVVGDNMEYQGLIPESNFYISQFALKRLEAYTQENPYTVPQGYFFAMGDNRDASHDSRYQDMGDIPYANLFGKVMR